MRLFIATHLPDPLLHRLEALQGELKTKMRFSNIRWTTRAQMHLTLRFFGHLPESEIEPLRAAIRCAAQQVAPAHLTLAGLGCFPNARRPSVIWVGVGGELEALQQIQQVVVQDTRAWGELEHRDFHPHFTLARIKDARPRQARQIQAALTRHTSRVRGEWTATSMELMQSELSPEAARYHLVESFLLGKMPLI